MPETSRATRGATRETRLVGLPPRLGDDGGLRLQVLDTFELWKGGQLVALPRHSQRVVAFLAVRLRPQLRSTVAFSLWPDSPENRARANLRTALWKIHPFDLVYTNGCYLVISPDTDVDLHRIIGQARRLIAPEEPLHPGDINSDALNCDLLPEWDEDWLHFERERLRQLRLHGLEALSERLSACSRHAEAIDAAQAAAAAEPLRESAQQVLIRAHIAEGNLSEARRQFERYAALLWKELGHAPSDQLRRLVDDDCRWPTAATEAETKG